MAALLWINDNFYGPGTETYERARHENAQPQSAISVRPEGRSYELNYQSRAEHPEPEFLGRSAETWIALLTLVLAVSTIMLWLDTRRLAAHAENEARESRRPIPLVRIGTDDPSVWDERSVIIRGYLKNVGAQPAYFYSLVAEAVLRPPDAPPPIPVAGAAPLSERGLQMSLLPGMLIIEARPTDEDGFFLDYWPKVAFTATDREAYRAGDLEVYFVGAAEYTDANANPRVVGFCYKLVRHDDDTGEPEHLERVLDSRCNYDRAKMN